MQVARLDILQSVAKQSNANFPQEMLREGTIHSAELTDYHMIQPLVNKSIMPLKLELVSLQVVVNLI